jgi:hypothetical protein
MAYGNGHFFRLKFSEYIIRRMELASQVKCTGQITNSYKILVEYTVWKGPLGRPRSRWANYTKVDLKGKRLLYEDVDLIKQARNRSITAAWWTQ